jgi:hypothetical protein
MQEAMGAIERCRCDHATRGRDRHYLLMVFGSGRASPQLSVSSRAGVPTAAGRATIPTGEPAAPTELTTLGHSDRAHGADPVG